MRYRFSDITINYDSKRVPLSAKQREEREGKYPYYGAQGIIDYIDDYIFDGKYLLIAEDGENLKSKKQKIAQLANGRYWVNNHAHIVQTNEKCLIEYLYYIFNTTDISGYITGSAQPKLSQANLNAIELEIPPMQKQEKIVSILSALDDKIELNQKINENLERQAQAIFKSWFVDFEPFNGERPVTWDKATLGAICGITSGKRPPMRQAEKTSTVNIPLVGAASVMGFTNAALYDEKILVTGRVGTHGVIQRFTSKCWASDNTLVITSKFYEFVYQVLQTVDYQNMNRGSTQPLITQTDMKNIPIILPTTDILEKFEGTVGTLMRQYEENNRQNAKLAEIRDTLLPKLMAGEIDLQEV